METLYIVLGVLAAIFICVALFKILRSVVKAIFITLLIAAVIIGVAGYFLYQDAKTLTQSIDEETTILVYRGDEAVAGIKMTPDLLNKGFMKYTHISKDSAETLTATPPEKGIIFIVQESYLFDEDVLLSNKQTATPAEMISIIHSDSEEEASQLTGYPITNLEETKTAVIGSAFRQKMKEMGANFIVQGAKTKSLETIPEFTSLQALGFVPEEFANKIINKKMDSE